MKPPDAPAVRLRDLVKYFLTLGASGFGGPAALIAQMERDLVEARRWISKEEFREAVAVCQSLPGPLAIQVGIFLSYLRAGFWGAWAGGSAFILPNFVIVATLGALYVRFGDLPFVRAIFYGVSPAVIALIVYSWYRLTKLGMEDTLQWAVAATCFLITVTLRAEVALLFLAAGILGVFYYGGIFRRPAAGVLSLVIAAAPSVAAEGSAGPILRRLLLFFLKAGSLTFGSGLVIVPFLEKGLVQQTGWLNERTFLVAVAIGMLSPGPVVITATFVGYLVAGLWGSIVSTLGIFFPSFVLVLVAASALRRYRKNRYVQGFVKGAYAAAIGTILGAGALLSRIAIGDWLTILIALLSLGALARWKLSTYKLVAITAAIGLVAFPILRPGWVLIK